MEILRDETVLALMDVDWEDGEVAFEAWMEAWKRGILP